MDDKFESAAASKYTSEELEEKSKQKAIRGLFWNCAFAIGVCHDKPTKADLSTSRKFVSASISV